MCIWINIFPFALKKITKKLSKNNKSKRKTLTYSAILNARNQYVRLYYIMVHPIWEPFGKEESREQRNLETGIPESTCCTENTLSSQDLMSLQSCYNHETDKVRIRCVSYQSINLYILISSLTTMRLNSTSEASSSTPHLADCFLDSLADT